MAHDSAMDTKTFLAALSAAKVGNTDGLIKIVPKGQFAPVDGRTDTGVAHWTMTASLAQQIIAAFDAGHFKVDMWDLLKSGNSGMVLQINEGDSGGDIALYASSDIAMKLELLNQELKHCREMLEQKDKEIELLRQLAVSVQK